MNPVVVGIAEYKFAQPPLRLVTYGLGSCVAIVLHSTRALVGSMAHVMLPLSHNRGEEELPGKFADTAVSAMLREMEIRGIEPSGLVAKMAGGADMFAGHFKGAGRRIGARNILAARKTLDRQGIRLVAQDVGGTVGRTVEYVPGTGALMVRTLQGGVKEL